ncbi:LysR family transcriptional regulator [Massilia sp. Root351]|jgi:DNA-binding transcriptional LysR family regulator|uniref:LysR substrate-binding domain-containing protein n=1 Tax=Massilia sp. Root351 TaxID=1736522 RepID=UPI00070C5B8F|nr:LysR substrate-binding domain-containing protein [Massilia sp. Root351]KQV90687.1 LysR family transcriptional regulator [Massilia sp. Root351]
MRGIELRQLRYFSIVAKELHFRRAAELAFVTQPALSQQIAKLEQTMGVELLRRDRRSVELTPAGAVLRDELDIMFSQMERALRLTREAGQYRSCTLSIGLVEYTNLAFIPPALIRLQALYPNVRILRHEMNSVLQMDALLKRTIDVGFGVQVAPLPADGSLRGQPIFDSGWALLLREDDPLAARAAITVDDLRSQRLIMFERRLNTDLYDRMVDSCRAHGFTPSFVYETSQPQMGMSLVGQGMGAMVGATYIFSAPPAGLVVRPVEGMGPLQVQVFSRGGEDNPLILEFIELVAAEARRAQFDLAELSGRS